MRCALPFFLQCSLFLLFTPSHKSKSRLGFNDGHSWSLGQTSIAAGGPSKSRSLPPLPPPLRIVLPNLGPAPILSGPEQPPNIGVVTVTPGMSLRATHPPSLLHAEVRSPTLLCSLFVQASPIPPHVVLISTQRTSVKTTNYVDTRAEFTPKPHTPGLYSDACVFRLDIIPSSLAL